MEFTLVCEEGTLDFRSGDRPLTLYRADGTTDAIATAEQDAFVAELTAFAESCTAGKAPSECPPEESAAAVAIAGAADLSRNSSGVRTPCGGNR